MEGVPVAAPLRCMPSHCLRPVTCRRQAARQRNPKQTSKNSFLPVTNSPLQFAAVRRPTPTKEGHTNLRCPYPCCIPQQLHDVGGHGDAERVRPTSPVAPSRGATGSFSARRRSLRNAKRGGGLVSISAHRSSPVPGDPWCRNHQIVQRKGDGPLKSLKPRRPMNSKSRLCWDPCKVSVHHSRINCKLRSEQAARILLEIARD